MLHNQIHVECHTDYLLLLLTLLLFLVAVLVFLLSLVDTPILLIEYYYSMKDVKDYVVSFSDWLLEHISMEVVASLFTAILVVQIGNWLHIDAFLAYSTASRAMDVVWWVDFGFTVIAGGNWFFRKLWKGLQQFW